MLKKIAIFILDRLPVTWRDFLFAIKRFWRKKRIFPQPQMLIFFTEKGKWHGGFTDRMKGIITLFHFCLCKNISFKINYTFPFELSDFLLPNEYDWQIDKQKISFNRKEAKFIMFFGKADRLKRMLNIKTKKQIHAFLNSNFVCELNDIFKTNYTWGELFKKLFKPTDELQEKIDKHLKIINGKYICAVFRFQNLLGDFQEYEFQPLSANEQNILLKKCKKALLELQEKEDCKKILVTSDSAKFLTSVIDLENIFAFPAKVVHIDCVENETHNVYMKSFLDFYLLSGGKKIFSIGADGMYDSDFPRYAAKVNDIPFERILIE